MPRCEVTVDGRTLEVEAPTLFRACLEYNREQTTGRAKDYPPLRPETVIEVRVAGQPEVRRAVWLHVMNWANRVAKQRRPAKRFPPGQSGSPGGGASSGA